MNGAPMDGTVEPGFEPVREVFEHAISNELGAAVSAYIDGRKVVDLWGGWADAERTREWEHDTIACTFSAVKGMTATCAHVLVDRGLLDVDEPVATYWPEFAQAGKEGVTVRMLLTHQAGLPFRPHKSFDWEKVTEGLAQMAPVWEPGSRSEYHGGSFGYLVGEVVRRIDGRPLSTFFTEEIAEPLGAEYMIAFGPEHDHRCAEMTGPDDMVGGSNTREWHAAGDGAATACGSADGLARVYAMLARGGELGGVRLLHAETIADATKEQPLLRGDGTVPDFGLGYQLLWKNLPFGNRKPFGHTGMGGSIGLADPAARLGIGYVMNKMPSDGAYALLPAIYQALRT